MPLKTNRKVASSGDDKKNDRYVRVDTLEIELDTVMTIYLESVDFPLHLVKQIFINEDGSTGTLYLVTSDHDRTCDEITTIYGTWNPIINRSSKMRLSKSRRHVPKRHKATISLLLCVPTSSWKC